MQKWIVLMVTSLFFQACVLKSQHDETMAAYIKSSSELSKIRKDSEGCKQKFSDLEQKIADLETRNQELSETNQQLVTKNKTLADKSTEAQSEYLKLIEEKNGINQHSVWLDRVNEQLIFEFRNEISKDVLKVEKSSEGVSLILKDSSLLPISPFDLPVKTKDILRRFNQVVRPYPEATIKTSGNADAKKLKQPSNLDTSSTVGLLMAKQMAKDGLPSKSIQVIAKDTNDLGMSLTVK